MPLSDYYTYYVNDAAYTPVTTEATHDQVAQGNVRIATPEDFALQEQKGIVPATPEHGATITDLIGAGAGKVKDAVAPIVSTVTSAVSSGYDQAMGNLAYKYATGDVNDLVAAGVLPGSSSDYVNAHKDEVIAAYEHGYDANGDGTVDARGADAVWAYLEANDQTMIPSLEKVAGGLDYLRGRVATEYADAVSKYATGAPMGAEDWFDLVTGTAIFGSVDAVGSIIESIPGNIDLSGAAGAVLPGAPIFNTLVNGSDEERKGLAVEWTTFGNWARDNPDIVQQALDNGYQADDGTVWEPGPRAVWEVYVGTLPWWRRGALDIAMDPLSYTPVALKAGGSLASIGENLVREGATPATRVVGRGAQVVGEALKVPYNVFDRPVDEIFSAASRATKGRVGTALGLDPSLTTKVTTEITNPLSETLRDVARRQGENLPDVPPAAAAPNPTQPELPPAPTEPRPDVGPNAGAPAVRGAPCRRCARTGSRGARRPGRPRATETVPGRQLQPGDSVLIDGSPHRVNDHYDLITTDGTNYGPGRAGADYDRIITAPVPAGEQINRTLEQGRLGQAPETSAAPPTSPEGRLQQPIEPPDPEVFGDMADAAQRRAAERSAPVPERVGGIRDQVEGQLAVHPEKQADIEKALTFYDRRIAPYIDGARRNMETGDKSAIRNQIAFTRLLRRAADRMEAMTGLPVRPIRDRAPFDANVETVLHDLWDSPDAVAARGRLHRGGTTPSLTHRSRASPTPCSRQPMATRSPRPVCETRSS